MRIHTLLFALIFSLASLLIGASPATTAAEPGWTPRVLKLGEDRTRTNARPIVMRPYRPLHFYGNAVRRRYYRGSPLPTADDLRKSFRLLIAR
jgi:hypothetical protein